MNYLIKDDEIDFSTAFTEEQKSAFNLISVKIKNDWIDVSISDCVIAYVNKSSRRYLKMIYQNKPVEFLKYMCSNCHTIVTTSWLKFKQHQIDKNKCLCRNCSRKSESNRRLISQKTKEAMQKESVKAHASKAQKERFAKLEEREKSKERSIEVMSRPEMREKISAATKKAMQTIRMEKSFQDKMITAQRKKLRNKKSQPQLEVEGFVKSIVPSDLVEDEFPINLYSNDSVPNSYFFLDIAMPSKLLAIEVLGIYHHLCFIEYFFDKKSINDIKKEGNKSAMQLEIFDNDLLRDDFLTKNGWKIFYVNQDHLSGSEWKDRLRRFLNEQK